MSPVCSQPSIERLGRLLRLFEVALEHVAAAADHLAVVGDPHLAAGDRLPDEAGLVALGRPRHRPARLAHAVDLRQRHTDRVEPLEDRRRDRRRARDRGDHLVEPDQRPHLAKATASRNAHVSRCSWVTVPARSAALDLDRRGDAFVELRLAVRVGGERGVDAAVDLLEHPRHTEHDLRVHLLEVGRELPGVGAAVHAEAEDQRLVVAHHPLGDVRHRQVRHDPLAREVVEREGTRGAARRCTRRCTG